MSATRHSRFASPVLLIGATGMLGRAWQQYLESYAIPFETPARHLLELTDPASIDRAVEERFRTVINCAAYTDVDGAETNEPEARALNAEAPGHLARACARTGALLVHYSTDYVFDGAAARPYGVTDTVRPQTAYGRTKAAGEDAIRQAGADHLILRTSWLVAPWGNNFVLTMMRMLRERDQVRVVRDQRGRPTSCRTLAGVSADLIKAGARGTLHACNSGDCTWFDLAQRIKLETRAPAPRHRLHVGCLPAPRAAAGLQRARLDRDRAPHRPTARLARLP